MGFPLRRESGTIHILWFRGESASFVVVGEARVSDRMSLQGRARRTSLIRRLGACAPLDPGAWRVEWLEVQVERLLVLPPGCTSSCETWAGVGRDIRH